MGHIPNKRLCKIPYPADLQHGGDEVVRGVVSSSDSSAACASSKYLPSISLPCCQWCFVRDDDAFSDKEGVHEARNFSLRRKACQKSWRKDLASLQADDAVVE